MTYNKPMNSPNTYPSSEESRPHVEPGFLSTPDQADWAAFYASEQGEYDLPAGARVEYVRSPDGHIIRTHPSITPSSSELS